jgi:hypothetical protein
MGNRSVIQINSTTLPYPISLYGHWAGEDNIIAVKNVITRTDRIGDANYLSAQLFYEFAVTLGGYDSNLGFGLHTGVYDEAWLDNPIVYVDADTGNYTYKGITYNQDHLRIEETTNA